MGYCILYLSLVVSFHPRTDPGNLIPGLHELGVFLVVAVFRAYVIAAMAKSAVGAAVYGGSVPLVLLA